jgi:hypothetical protein
MTKLYRALRDEPSYDAKKGDEVELELGVMEEQDLLAAKRLEIVPRRYKVVGPQVAYDTEPGGEFEAALLIEHEAALIAGGHIERVDKPAPVTKQRKGG